MQLEWSQFAQAFEAYLRSDQGAGDRWRDRLRGCCGGGWWAMQEDGFLSEDGVHWSYEGLRELEEGDDFTVYADNGSVLWDGIIHQNTITGSIPRQVVRNGKLVNHRTWKQQISGGTWVHWVQGGIDPMRWGELFVGNSQCCKSEREG